MTAEQRKSVWLHTDFSLSAPHNIPIVPPQIEAAVQRHSIDRALFKSTAPSLHFLRGAEPSLILATRHAVLAGFRSEHGSSSLRLSEPSVMHGFIDSELGQAESHEVRHGQGDKSSKHALKRQREMLKSVIMAINGSPPKLLKKKKRYVFC